MRKTRRPSIIAGILLLAAVLTGHAGDSSVAPVPTTGALNAIGSGVRYDVCATCPYTELTTIPWNELTAASVANIYYRSAPYKTKIALRVSGTAAAPIIINGVVDAAGNRPVISGDGAVTAKSNANTGIYSDEHPEYGEGLALILN
jgi:hypothetical protein